MRKIQPGNKGNNAFGAEKYELIYKAALGLTLTEVATAMGISEGTVANVVRAHDAAEKRDIKNLFNLSKKTRPVVEWAALKFGIPIKEIIDYLPTPATPEIHDSDSTKETVSAEINVNSELFIKAMGTQDQILATLQEINKALGRISAGLINLSNDVAKDSEKTRTWINANSDMIRSRVSDCANALEHISKKGVSK